MKRPSSHLTELIFNALLASYHYKKPMKVFLRRMHISENVLATWGEEESKRDFLYRLFPKLEQSPRGTAVLLDIARAVAEQQSFPDLEKLEDSADRIQAAHRAIARLRSALRSLNEEERDHRQANAAREAHRQHQDAVRQETQDLGRLNNRLVALTKSLGAQQAGYDFQTWFYDLMAYCEVQHRKPYVIEGRQIDGSVTISGTTYLVEAKFTVSKTDAPEIDSLLSKVTSKADNTMGIMMSMAGYTSVAIRTASSARTPLLLLDHAHVFYVLTGGGDFSEVVDRVRRHASQTGEAYLPLDRFGG